jgi:uncharacterized membrane protein
VRARAVSNVLSMILVVAYPLAIFAGMHYWDARTLSLLVLAVLALRYRLQAAQLLSGFRPAQLAAFSLPPLLGLAVLVTNSEALLRLYPASISLCALILFGATLARPPSMIERFARLEQPDLPVDRVRYTRVVTQVWCAFFVANCAIAVYTALFASREAWVLYNGLIAYCLMGLLLGGERLLRRRLVALAQ